MNAFEGMQCPDCIPGHLSLIGVDPNGDLFPEREYWVTFDLYQCDFCGQTFKDTDHPVAYIDDAYIPLESLDPNWRSVINTRRAIAMKLQPMLPGDWSCTT
jgi:hypothetical protein